jgi:hypothetical protein
LRPLYFPQSFPALCFLVFGFLHAFGYFLEYFEESDLFIYHFCHIRTVVFDVLFELREHLLVEGDVVLGFLARFVVFGGEGFAFGAEIPVEEGGDLVVEGGSAQQ